MAGKTDKSRMWDSEFCYLSSERLKIKNMRRCNLTMTFSEKITYKLSLSTYIICRNKPRHFCARSQLSINKTFNFTFCPPIVDVHNSNHVPLKTKQNIV
jgi:hypothetical protein